jgi:hypothetical protein
MQTQGPKTIGHMKSYISMLDFTSVPAWIILYCFTAGSCFSCLSCKFFLSGILHWVFSGYSMYLSVFPHTAPLRVKSADWDFFTWFTPWFKRCGPSLGFFNWLSPNFFYRAFSLVILTWGSPHPHFYNSVCWFLGGVARWSGC